MSSNVIEQPLLAPVVEKEASTRRRWSPRLVAAIGAPVLVAIVALLVHRLASNTQSIPKSWMDSVPEWRRPYPLLLSFMLLFSLLLVIAQWISVRIRPWAYYYAPLIAGGLGMLCLWDVTTVKMAWLPQPFFPGPDEVFGALIEDTVYSSVMILARDGSLSDALAALMNQQHGLLLVSTWHSLRLLLAGYIMGTIAGLIWGVLIGWFRMARYWGMPVLKLVGPMPATALVPLAMMLSSNSFLCSALLIAYAVWFPVTMLTASGIANVKLSYLDVARTLGAGKRFLILRVAIPSALPNVFLGLFMGLGASFLTLPAAEFGVKSGLGWYVGWKKSNAEYGKVFASLIIMAIFFSSLMTLLFKVRDRVLKWQRGTIRW